MTSFTTQDRHALLGSLEKLALSPEEHAAVWEPHRTAMGSAAARPKPAVSATRVPQQKPASDPDTAGAARVTLLSVSLSRDSPASLDHPHREVRVVLGCLPAAAPSLRVV